MSRLRLAGPLRRVHMARITDVAGVLLIAAQLVHGAAAGEDVPTTQPSSEREPAATAPAPDAATTPSILDIESLTLELGFEGGYDRRRSRFETRDVLSGTYVQTNRSLRLEETLGLTTTGALFDRKFMLFDAFLEGGFSQEWFSETSPGRDREERPDGSSLNYDLNFHVLPQGKLSGTAYVQRLDSRLPRMFQPSLDRTRERYGAVLLFNDARLPMRLSYEHVWDELTSRTRDLLDDEQRGRDTLRYEATWQIAENHALRLDYEYDDRREEYSGSRTRFDTNRNQLTLVHTLRFGRDQRSIWETTARLQDESGDLGRDMTEVSTRLRLQHTDRLATNMSAQYLRDAFQELKTTTWRGEGGLTYEWTPALTTSVQLYALDQSANENADFLEWGGVASADYSRETNWGRFTASASYNHVATDTRYGTRRGIAIAESVTLRDPLVAYLAHTDVDLASIIVADATRARTYLPGRDYIIIRVGRYAALRRVQNGQITDRQTVLVSYTYRVAADYDLSRDRIDLRVQHAFTFGLTPYYAGSIQDEDIDRARFLRFRARNANRHRVGATFRRPRWSAGMEYEFNDDAIDPYQALHGNGDIVLWQDARNQLDGKGTLSHFWFDGSDGLEARDTLLLDLGLAFRHLLAQDFEANASAMYRYEDDSLYGVTHGVDLTTALEWHIGYFSLRFEAEYDLLSLPGSRDNDVAVWLKLKREIPVIAKGAR